MIIGVVGLSLLVQNPLRLARLVGFDLNGNRPGCVGITGDDVNATAVPDRHRSQITAN